ncbi:recombinase family protein [Caldivirga sp. UBA161]|uniref:recombinase family protein n=1 Tax=Caldivirga sp. UBA161 TaxID=1915569 RepID=UPI0025C4E618|nr:recombinase family protein [Caldivirga sp. UBA161]
MVNAVAYLRVSTEEQELGLDAQRSGIVKFASMRGIEVREFFIDQGVSGSIPALEREGFRKSIDYARANGVNLLVVYSLDRLSRSFTDLFNLLRKLDEDGISVISVREEFLQDLNPMVRRLVLSILAWAADYERYLIRERTRAALRAKGIVKATRVDPSLAKAVAALYQHGESIKLISSKVGLSERQVRKILYSNGVLTPPPSTCPRCFHRLKWDEQYNTWYCPNCGYLKP